MSAYAFALAWPVRGQDGQDGGRQGRLAVVDVPDRAHVDVRFGPGEGFLGHLLSSRSCILEVEVVLAGTRPAAPHANMVRSGGLPTAGAGRRAPSIAPPPECRATDPKAAAGI